MWIKRANFVEQLTDAAPVRLMVRLAKSVWNATISLVCRSIQAVVTKNAQIDNRDEAPVFAVEVNNAEGSTKRSLSKLKIAGVEVDMQLDSRSEATIIPKNFWVKLDEPKLTRTKSRLRQFDGTEIKTAGEFQACVELRDRFTMTNVVVAECNKHHGLVGTDIL